MNQDEARQLENQLIVMGLNRLDDPALIPALAKIINAHPGYLDPHDFYIGMLNECDQEKRGEMYEALRPHLKFSPWPLEQYISRLREHAANVESVDAPVQIGEKKKAPPVIFGGHKFEECDINSAESVILELTCYKCTFHEEFMGLTPVQAVMAARQVGWARDLVKQAEICPKCPAIRPN